ncbi:hypothetical protein D3Z36_14725 [Lachnospiraceae bacterium]|nr:hypothetical protein [Lachnospiraceae bacterium]
MNLLDLSVRSIVSKSTALAALSEDEQKLVNAIFFQELSEREWLGISGILQKTINDRKRRILAKLKNFWKNKKFFRSPLIFSFGKVRGLFYGFPSVH